jgi:small Trp-rich protein
MVFVGVGLLLVLLRWAEIGPVGQWSWWWTLVPFVLAAAWWAWSDATGLTRRREMDKLDARRAERRARQVDALGLGSSGKSRRAARTGRGKPR